VKKGVLAILLAAVLLLAAAPLALADDPSNPFTADTPPDQDVPKGEAVIAVVGSVVQVDPATIQCDILADLEDVPLGNYDGILVSGGLKFAERFKGQTRADLIVGPYTFDELSGSPTSPLELQIGAANENVNVATWFDQVVDGLGPGSWVGEGSLAVLFPSPQSQFKFDIIGSDGGATSTATLNFFKADGTSLGTIVIAPVADQTYGFKQIGGTLGIAGFSIHNTDPEGIGYDNICYAVEVGGSVESVNLSELNATSSQLSDGSSNNSLVALWVGLALIAVVGGGLMALRQRRTH
jgi:hypothetical protein